MSKPTIRASDLLPEHIGRPVSLTLGDQWLTLGDLTGISYSGEHVTLTVTHTTAYLTPVSQTWTALADQLQVTFHDNPADTRPAVTDPADRMNNRFD